jgi:hypothetical protein
MPNVKDYRALLEESSGPCTCPSLTKLREQSRLIHVLQMNCQYYVRNGVLDHMINPEDREFADPLFTSAYKVAAQQLEKAVGRYDEMMAKEIKRGTMCCKLHEPGKENKKRDISYEDAQRYLAQTEFGKGQPISINCTVCLQVWEVAV